MQGAHIAEAGRGNLEQSPEVLPALSPPRIRGILLELSKRRNDAIPIPTL
jgi:hypothetical protein